jgi:hypothetical protein
MKRDELPRRDGESVTVGKMTVTRVAYRVYHLQVADNQYRSRWGTANEILTDIAYVEQTGYLPPREGKSWS